MKRWVIEILGLGALIGAALLWGAAIDHVAKMMEGWRAGFLIVTMVVAYMFLCRYVMRVIERAKEFFLRK